MSIAENLRIQNERVTAACSAAGRDPSSVRLIAVSKLKPIAAIEEAYAAGQRDFGENYVQELLKKRAALEHLPDLRFHLIGQLQTKKCRQIVDQVASVQTVDSLKLVHELAKRAAAKRLPTDGPLNIMLEVHLSDEESKGGCTEAVLPELVNATMQAPCLNLKGLMTIAPGDRSTESARKCFERLAQLKAELEAQWTSKLPALELSMGMTGDLEVAVAAGATLVRVGRAIFGEREPRVMSES